MENKLGDRDWNSFGLMQFKGMEDLWGLYRKENIFLELLVNKSKGETQRIFGKTLRTLDFSVLETGIKNAAAECRFIASMKLQEEAQQLILRDRRTYIRGALLYNKSCNEGIVCQLLRSNSISLAVMTAKSKKLSLIKNKRYYHWLALKTQVITEILLNPECPKGIIEHFIHRNSLIGKIASNENITRENILLIMRAQEVKTLVNLAMNQSLPKDLQKRLAASKYPKVRSAIATRKDVVLSLLAKLCMDQNLETRSIASNRLEEALGSLKLTDWCTAVVGVSSPRITTLVQKLLKRKAPIGWFVILADFLRRVFPTNPTDYLNALEALANNEGMDSLSIAKTAFENDSTLEVAFKVLSKEDVIRFLSNIDPVLLKDWQSKTKALSPFFPFIQSELKQSVKETNFKSLEAFLKHTHTLLLKQESEVNEAAPTFIPLAASINQLSNLTFSGKYYLHAPTTVDELVELGSKLSNCLRQRRVAIEYALGEETVVSVVNTETKKPAYLFTINRHGIIRSLRGPRNTALPPHIAPSIKGFLSENLKDIANGTRKHFYSSRFYVMN